jgi:hypothetical protein
MELIIPYSPNSYWVYIGMRCVIVGGDELDIWFLACTCINWVAEGVLNWARSGRQVIYCQESLLVQALSSEAAISMWNWASYSSQAVFLKAPCVDGTLYMGPFPRFLAIVAGWNFLPMWWHWTLGDLTCYFDGLELIPTRLLQRRCLGAGRNPPCWQTAVPKPFPPA